MREQGRCTLRPDESGRVLDRLAGLEKVIPPEMIRQAREAYPQITFEVADGTSIPLEKTFDAIFSNATLHWIKEPELVIREVARLLKSGGRFVAEFGGHGNIAKLVRAAERAWVKLWLPTPMPNPWYYPSVAEYASLLEGHGLTVTYAILFDRRRRWKKARMDCGTGYRCSAQRLLTNFQKLSALGFSMRRCTRATPSYSTMDDG